MSELLPIQESPNAVTFDVMVAPRASRERIGPVSNGRLKVAITAPPVEGQANAALIQALARVIGISRARVSVVSGKQSRRKTVQVQGLTAAALRRVLNAV